MGEQVLRGLAFSLLVDRFKPIFPRFTGCNLIALANCLKPNCRYMYHLLCHFKKYLHLVILSVYVFNTILTITKKFFLKQHN
jgi:hypothetical protein